MGFSLYEATIPSYLQMLDAVSGLLQAGERFCDEKGIAPADLIEARLAADMLPFAYQVKSAAVHSIGAIEGVRRGAFAPDRSDPPASFAALAARVGEARDACAALDKAEIDGFIGRDMTFSIGDYRLEFTADQFLLSFSQPNFYFHVTTAYDILRARGVPIGKRDFLGRPRVKDRA